MHTRIPCPTPRHRARSRSPETRRIQLRAAAARRVDRRSTARSARGTAGPGFGKRGRVLHEAPPERVTPLAPLLRPMDGRSAGQSGCRSADGDPRHRDRRVRQRIVYLRLRAAHIHGGATWRGTSRSSSNTTRTSKSLSTSPQYTPISGGEGRIAIPNELACLPELNDIQRMVNVMARCSWSRLPPAHDF